MKKDGLQEFLATGVLPITLFIVVLLGAIRGVDNQVRKHYTPGQSLPEAKRELVNQMNDSTLNARVGQYYALWEDYINQLYGWSSAEEKYTPKMQRRLHNPRFEEYLNANNVNTNGKYLKLLKRYERDSIETRYKQLAKQLAKQK